MNWETYRQLSPEQQEEWTFKFDKHPFEPPFQSWFTTLLLLWGTISIYMMATYIAYTSSNPELIALKPTLMKSIEATLNAGYWFVKITALFTIIWTVRAIYHFYSERKWIKQQLGEDYK